MPSTNRKLSDLNGVGRATIQDLQLLGVTEVPELALQDPDELYQRLCRITGVKHDICCLDVFRCAVAQARDPDLPAEQRQWWYWTQKRKSRAHAADSR